MISVCSMGSLKKKISQSTGKGYLSLSQPVEIYTIHNPRRLI